MRTVRVVVVGVCSLLLVTTGASSFAASSSPDRGIAQTGVLTLQDFPAGWAPKAKSSSNDALSVKLVSTTPVCKPVRPLYANAKTATRTQSPSDFTDGTLTVSNSVSVYPDVAHADLPFAAAKGPALSACFQRVLQKVIPVELAKSGHASSVQNLAVAVQPTNPGVAAGDDQAAFAATVTVTAKGGAQQSIYFEDIVVRVGRALDTFSYENESSPISDSVPSAINASVARLQAALGA
jgi:hypothetical protein